MKTHGQWSADVEDALGRTVLTRSVHKAPLKVAKPFRGTNGELIIYLMDASPGLFGGDEQQIECNLGPRASLFLTTQAAQRLYPAIPSGKSRQRHRFHVARGALLEYFPEPLVPVADAEYDGDFQIRLESGGHAFIGEVIAAGRVGRDETYRYRRVTCRFTAWWGGRLAVYDPMDLQPSLWQDREVLFADYTHLGTLWILSESAKDWHIESLRTALGVPVDTDGTEVGGFTRDLYVGVSKLQHAGYVVRMLGCSAWRVQDAVYRCHQLLRQQVLGRDPLTIRK